MGRLSRTVKRTGVSMKLLDLFIDEWIESFPAMMFFVALIIGIRLALFPAPPLTIILNVVGWVFAWSCGCLWSAYVDYHMDDKE